MSWYDLGTVAFWCATVVSVLFALAYLVFAPWWRTVAGRNTMALMGSLALTFGYFGWVIWLRRVPPGFMQVRVFLFFGIALAIGWRTVIFIRYHIIPSLRTGREHKNELEDSR